DAFVEDYRQRSDDALAEWIERLMDSPAWGEHRARYWLDAARYADTHGMHFDNYREMWPYRDWVIRAFNANEPFDQFVVEQIAGDLLPEPTQDQLIATGFQRCNITTNEGGTIDEENLALYATDRVQTFGWVFLGMTTNCAQCHDHKFDSFTMKDFYSLAAFFRNTTQPAKDGNVKDGRGPALIVPSDEDRARWDALPSEIAQATSARDQRKETAKGDFEQWLASTTPESFEPLIPAEGLAVHLPLTEGEGKTATNTCDPSNLVQATSEISWIAEGKLGPAPVIQVDATYVLGQLGNFEKNQGFSDGAWIRLGEDDSGGIIAKIDAKNGYRGWDLWQQGKSIEVDIVDALSENAIKVVTKDAVLITGQWQHVFATYDGSGKAAGVKIFIDGHEVPVKIAADTLKPEASIHTETPLRIGQRSDGQYFSDGAVQDVRIYERTLSPDEVQALYKLVPVQAALAMDAEKRLSQQQDTLYSYYLETTDSQYASLAKAVVDLTAEREAIQRRSAVTLIQEERNDSPAMANILMRGEYDRPIEEVQAATPAALHPMPEGAPRNRLGLGEWLVDPANPLTARVTVNRFWQQLFGRGIVETTENLGVSGALPTHPELLDWLAVEFHETGWDVKRFFKLMLMSHTYRQSAVITPEKLEQDPENILFSRGPRFRMDAEMVRDYALAVSGLLSPKMYGPSV
ncbi:MAG: DUF1549 domain-containing protein, partial [Planctomycetaceae bacterium]|nr:DUF1549 domain-containing protein [Planctomycetaceae bacterium]